MDNKRQTITLTRDFYNATKWMKDENRLEFYDMVFRSLFDNKDIDFEKVKSENVASALAILSPALSAITSKYENRVGKKLKSTPSPFLCSPSSIEMERNGTKQNGDFSSDYYSIYNILYNVIINQSSIKSNKLKYIKYENLNLLQNALNQINNQCDEKTIKKLKQVFEKLSANEVVSINGVAQKSIFVIDKIVELLLSPNAPLKIKEKVEELNELSGIRNPVGYLISALYNLACEKPLVVTKPKTTRSYTDQEIMRHNYTKEQIDSIFNTDLDKIEI